MKTFQTIALFGLAAFTGLSNAAAIDTNSVNSPTAVKVVKLGDTSSQDCDGLLMGPNIVLTTAECVDGLSSKDLAVDIPKPGGSKATSRINVAQILDNPQRRSNILNTKNTILVLKVTVNHA